jgi:hypothetical protein
MRRKKKHALVSLATGRVLERKLGNDELVIREPRVGVVDVCLELSEVLAVPVLRAENVVSKWSEEKSRLKGLRD